jgi:hypothetical protein
VEVARFRRTQHTGQKLAISQWGHDKPSRPSASAGPPHASSTMAPENRVRDVISIDIALGQMFEAGRRQQR